MKSTLILITAILSFLTLTFATGSTEPGDKFPLRKKYPHLPTISTEEFAKLANPIVVDARNQVEFDVIHVKGATNVLVGDMKKADLTVLRASNPEAPIVFYCNGTTCSKSYKAADKASIWGFENFFVYDTGIFDWGKSHAERTVFFGKSYAQKDLDDLLLSKDQLHKRCLGTQGFIDAIQSGDYKVFDVRDKKERQEFPIKLKGLARISMDDLVSMIGKGAFDGKKLLCLDNVGKQVRWLQYHLERSEIAEYYFLKGGILQWQEDGFSAKGKR